MAATVPPSNRVEVNLKREFDSTAEELGLAPTAALTIFMKLFVADGGFPLRSINASPLSTSMP